MDSLFYIISDGGRYGEKIYGEYTDKCKKTKLPDTLMSTMYVLFSMRMGFIFSGSMQITKFPREVVKHRSSQIRYGSEEKTDRIPCILPVKNTARGPLNGPAMTYPDYYVGPVMNSSAYGYQQDSTWSYIWKLNRTEIEYHQDHYGDQGYQPIHDILTWPGNGNVTLGQAAKLAPFC